MPSKRAARRVVVAGLATVVAVGAAVLYRMLPEYLDRPKAVVLITVDTLRADRLSSYGYRRARTAAIDRLAAEGARFETAYCDIPWTTGSMASVMTGSYGNRHGVRFRWTRLPEDMVTLAETLLDEGFSTGAIIGIFTLDSVWNLDQGFETYNDSLSAPTSIEPEGEPPKKVDMVLPSGEEETRAVFAEKERNDAYRPDAEVTNEALEWLYQHQSERFFLWAHYFGPHERLIFDKTGRQSQRIIEDYDKDLADTDRAIGWLIDGIDRLGLAERTLVIFHSDHGQALGEHGVVGHGRDLYEASVRVPLVVRYPPTVAAGKTVGTTVRNIDIMPTILDYLGVEARQDIQGRSLRPLIEGRDVPSEPALMEVARTPSIRVEVAGVGEMFGRTDAMAVRSGLWKYVRTALREPCYKNPTDYRRDLTSVNPTKVIGGTRIADHECASYLAEALYYVGTGTGGLSAEQDNMLERYPDVAAPLREFVETMSSRRGTAEEFETTAEQDAKLESLGYLE